MDISNKIGGSENVVQLFGEVKFTEVPKNNPGNGDAHFVELSSTTDWGRWDVAHELAHGWDAVNAWKHSEALEGITGGYTDLSKAWPSSCGGGNTKPGCNDAGYFYGGVPPKGSDSNFNRLQDFAESFAAYIYPGDAKDFINQYFSDQQYVHLHYGEYLTTPRGMWMAILIYLSTHP
jgi:hypothetical protein